MSLLAPPPNVKQSTDVQEDMIITCDRKSEFVSLLSLHWKNCNNSSSGSTSGKTIPIAFGNTFRMRASTVTAISVCPAAEVSFTEAASLSETAPLQVDKGAATANVARLSAPKGLSHDVVEEKRKRQAVRAKKAEQKRRAAVRT